MNIFAIRHGVPSLHSAITTIRSTDHIFESESKNSKREPKRVKLGHITSITYPSGVSIKKESTILNFPNIYVICEKRLKMQGTLNFFSLDHHDTNGARVPDMQLKFYCTKSLVANTLENARSFSC